VSEIYKSEKRDYLLRLVNAQKWGPAVAQPTSRTARLDRIANAVREGLLSDKEISDIRRASLDSRNLILD